MISILTPTRNRRAWIRRAVQSVLNQTFEDWELIILDVGDEGKTVEDLIADDPRIRYVRGQCAGPAADFQAALQLAEGEIVTPLSDDDRLPRRALEIANDLMERTLCDWMNGRTVIVDEAGDPLHLRGGVWEHVEDTRRGQYMLGGAVYWRKNLTDELGGFSSEFDGAADVDLYRRFLTRSDPVRTKQVLYIYTDHPGTDSRVNRARQVDAAQRAVERSSHAVADPEPAV